MKDRAMCFAKGNVEDLRDKLCFLLSEDSTVKQIKKDASSYICKKYNWDDVVEQTLEIYNGNKGGLR